MLARIRWLCIALLVPAHIAFAQPDAAYYQAVVPVQSQSANERQRAAQQAFLDVIFRISGFEAAASDPQIVEKSKQALRYVEQYQYGPLSHPELQAAGHSLMLSLSFSPAVIEKILNESRQPFWSNRPTTLVWLVEDDAEEGKQLLNKQSGVEAIASLEKAAGVRGMPLIFPVLDLDERLAVSAEKVWDVDETAILAASERYGADVVLVGKYSRTSRGELWSTWHFFHAGTSRSYDNRLRLGEEEYSLDALGASALFPLADFLAERYAIQPFLETGSRLVVQLGGVRDFASYRRALDYLNGLAAVSQLHLAGVRHDTLLLYLDSGASVDKFLKVISLDNKLKVQSSDKAPGPVWEQVPVGTLENPLRFIWSS